ncbi:hypothetical protein BT67DRAFT_53547 [Trichocladium antarcticum]|uniref:Uncharacterized protein n=1 Tax=Trichocladium antarcticum TaxID=1450529 RepID=A0AAN6UIU5_9PEZI|nr:hypothetical protein BT67DRAFT_53547 [Trichocladium antarcticum]
MRMTGGVSLEDGIPTVLDHATTNLESVKEACGAICGAAEPLAGIGREANRLIGALALVRDLAALQTPEVGARALAVVQLGALLASSMNILGAETRHHQAEPRELQARDRGYSHLDVMLRRLTEEREALAGAVAGVYVGLQGDVVEGFRVSGKGVVSVNGRVRGALGVDTVLFTRLQHRLCQTEDIIKLDDADAEQLGLPQRSSTRIEQWRAGVSE